MIPVVDVTGAKSDKEATDPFKRTVYVSQLIVVQLLTVSTSVSSD
jgi:hypothetical protein